MVLLHLKGQSHQYRSTVVAMDLDPKANCKSCGVLLKFAVKYILLMIATDGKSTIEAKVIPLSPPQSMVHHGTAGLQ